jgi:hypothetical protein
MSKIIKSTIILFADVSVIYIEITDESNGEILQKYIDNANKWVRKNMREKVSKCNLVSLGRGSKGLKRGYRIKCREELEVDSYKYLKSFLAKI